MALRILLLEDDPSLAEVDRLLLESGDHKVTWTPSGIQALAIASHERFDLALLDVEVEELSGLGVERVLQDLNGVPAVVMSAQSNGWRKEALRAGAVACLQKPFDVDNLLDLTHAIEVSGRKGPDFVGDVRELTRSDLDRIEAMSRAEMEALPFGAIRLDPDGRIITYNAFEANAAGLPPEEVIGKRFIDVAPCMAVREFLQLTERVREGKAVDEVFRYVFPHHGGACVVSVRLYVTEGDHQLWLFVSKRPGPSNEQH